MKFVSVPEAVVSDPSQNLTDILERRLRDSSDPVLYRVQKTPGNWVPVRASQFKAEVAAIAKGLMASGIGAGDVVGIMSRTRYEWTLVDFAIWYAGAISVPVYETSSPSQAAWALSHSEAKAAFVENDRLAQVIEQAGDIEPLKLNEVYVFDNNALEDLKRAGEHVTDEELEARRSIATGKSTATIVYTSGTTGRPKGCMLTHGNFLGLANQVSVGEPDVASPSNSTIIFLPLAHVLAREVQILAINSGLEVGHSPDIKNLTADLSSFKPSVLLVVPRVFEKVYEASIRKAEKGGKLNAGLFKRSVKVANAWSKASIAGNVPRKLQMQYKFYDKMVYAKLREALGGRLRYAVSGGGSLAPQLGHFFHAVGVKVIEGYGMTETTGSISVGRVKRFDIGNVGPLLPGASARIAEDGELEVTGIGVMKSYYNNPEENAVAFTEDGWLRTGDLARIDERGFIHIVGRKKEIIVTAGGKNVVPGAAEDRLRTSPMVSNAMLVGDEKPFIAALVTLDPDTLPDELEHLGLPRDMSISDASVNPKVREAIQKLVDEANALVSRAEAIREFRIAPKDFTEEAGHLTPSQKIRRSQVMKDFSSYIEEMYNRTKDSVNESSEKFQAFKAEKNQQYQAFKAEKVEKLHQLSDRHTKKGHDE